MTSQRHRRIEPRSDVRLLRRWAAPPTSGRARTVRALAPLGDNLKPWLAVSPILIANGQRGRQALTTGWQAVGVAAVVANAVGRGVRRGRPTRAALGHRVLAGHEPSSSSFPSTHTSSAVAFATAASTVLPRSAPLLAPLAALVAWTRPAGGRHYPSDVLGGAAIGAAAAAAIVHRHRARTATRRAVTASSAVPAPDSAATGERVPVHGHSTGRVVADPTS